ncbi:BQ5605_C057g12678 [Microbotryum silenes-dioicae]|uniref:Eukaryotic translation initiation factor 4E n=1 Tax=Microbotryum silenes-dioicae TaxID=796604 RepID=A0A2X0PH29_9BASI|nr:BQ5605_C013g07059 [Microbotryum silenes-dioicae]SGZ29391.1 BQ5605_C057g12678 [Microbotryum silenes-dioicae]
MAPEASTPSAEATTPTVKASNLPPAAASAAAAAVASATAQASHDDDTEQDETEASNDNKPSGALVTVFDDRVNFNVKHPLCSPWTLWFDSASKQDKGHWDEALVKVIGFESVEEFWGLYNNIVPPSLIHLNSNYYLFKEGIKPAWEDPANSKGGKWAVQLPRGKYSAEIDNYWLYTMLAAIGEMFETPFDKAAATNSTTAVPSAFTNEVTGVIVSSRKAFYRINIWTRTATPDVRARIENIGRHLKYDVLGMEEGIKFSDRDKVSSDVEFVSHKDSQAKYGTKVTKWTV